MGEQQGPLQRTAEALLLSLTQCRCSVWKKREMSKDQRGGFNLNTRAVLMQEAQRHQPNAEVQN